PHSLLAASIAGAEEMARIAHDAQETPAHLRAGPVRHAAAHDDLAAAHLGAQVHARVPVDLDPPTRHPFPDVLDPGKIAVEADDVLQLALDVGGRHLRAV